MKITDNTLDIPCVFEDRYISGTIINNSQIKPKEIMGFVNYDKGFQVFQNGWKYTDEDDKGGRLVFEVEARNIILLYMF